MPPPRGVRFQRRHARRRARRMGGGGRRQAAALSARRRLRRLLAADPSRRSPAASPSAVFGCSRPTTGSPRAHPFPAAVEDALAAWRGFAARVGAPAGGRGRFGGRQSRRVADACIVKREARPAGGGGSVLARHRPDRRQRKLAQQCASRRDVHRRNSPTSRDFYLDGADPARSPRLAAVRRSLGPAADAVACRRERDPARRFRALRGSRDRRRARRRE